MKIDFHRFSTGKEYACVVEEKDRANRRVFLRNIAFLHPPSDLSKIVVVREWGTESNRQTWEPPKGQMEWKEFAAADFKPRQDITPRQLVAAMRKGLLRELAEEAKLTAADIRDFALLPLSYTEPFEAAGKNAVFRYQFWEGVVTEAAMRRAQGRMEELVGNPETWADIPADKKEKNAVAWWKPTSSEAWRRIRGAFSGTMVRMYYDQLFLDP
jgi:hypothetical protein